MPPGLALFRAFPKLEATIARTPLGSFPTPVEHAARLGQRIGVSALYVKRDEDTSPLYGGGKVRKLELFFGDAIARGKRSVVTFGGAGSNQAVATAVLGKSLGLDVTVCLAPQPPGETVRRNLLAVAGTGATIRPFASVSSAERAVQDHHDEGTYVIPMGGTSPLGNLSFVSAGLELAEQIASKLLPKPDAIYVALGSGGSVLGVAIGLALSGIDSEVIGVRASNPTTVTEATLARMLGETALFARSLGLVLPDRLEKLRLRIDGREVGRGYGYATSAGESARAMARETEGYELEPVYGAKAFAALVRDAPGDQPILFWSSASRPPEVDPLAIDHVPRELRGLARTRS